MHEGIKDKIRLAFYHQADRPVKSSGFEGKQLLPDMMPVLCEDLRFSLICQPVFVRLPPVLGPRKPFSL